MNIWRKAIAAAAAVATLGVGIAAAPSSVQQALPAAVATPEAGAVYGNAGAQFTSCQRFNLVNDPWGRHAATQCWFRSDNYLYHWAQDHYAGVRHSNVAQYLPDGVTLVHPAITGGWTVDGIGFLVSGTVDQNASIGICPNLTGVQAWDGPLDWPAGSGTAADVWTAHSQRVGAAWAWPDIANNNWDVGQKGGGVHPWDGGGTWYAANHTVLGAFGTPNLCPSGAYVQVLQLD